MLGPTAARARATDSLAFADRCQPLLQPEQWTIPIVSDEHGILGFGDPFEQNETTQELPLSADTYQEMDVELSSLHVPWSTVIETQLAVEDMESLSAELYQPVYTLMTRAEAHENITKADLHHEEVPSTLFQETMVVGMNMESINTDLGTLLTYGDLGPVSVDDINIERLPFDTVLESLSNDTHQFGNTSITDMKHLLNTLDPFGHLHTPATFRGSTKEQVRNAEGKRDENLETRRTENEMEIWKRDDICDKQFGTSGNFQKNRRRHGAQKPFQCGMCSKQFFTSYSCQRHQRPHTGERPFQCEMCSKQFFTFSDPQRHQRTHAAEKPFQCDICLKQFCSFSECQMHRRVHTEEKPFQCDTCLKRFHTSSHYKAHRLIHTGEKPFQCDICSKQFRTSSDYQKHRRVHTGEKPFQCDICPKKFRTSDGCKTHRRKHTGEKPFQCDICPKQFHTSGNYKMHRRIHTGEKPFQCDICPKQFRAYGHYQTHRRTHTGEKPFQCDICRRQFSTSSNCQRHRRRTHTEEWRKFRSSNDSMRHRC